MKPRHVLLIAAVIALCVLPHFLEIYWQHVGIYTLWFVYLCVAWNIGCSTGMVSLCHTLFIGAGAYTSTLLFLHFGISPWLGMIPGAGVALLIALAVGWLCFPRGLPPLSFVIISMALAFSGIAVVLSSPSFLGGDKGFSLFFTSPNPWNYQFISKLPYYYIILAMTIGIIATHMLIVRSKVGLYFRSINDNERGAAAAGVNIVRYKLIALGLSAFLCALAGTFWAQYSCYVNPENVMDIHLSVLLILFVTIGGFGTVWGPIFAATILVPLGEILRAEMGVVAGLDHMVYGALIIVTIVYMPQGIWPNLIRQLAKRRELAPSDGSHSHPQGT